MLRSFNSGTRAAPYDSLMVADIGDVNVNLYDLKDTCTRIREFYRRVLSAGCIPLTMGEEYYIISYFCVSLKAASPPSNEIPPCDFGLCQKIISESKTHSETIGLHYCYFTMLRSGSALL